MVKPAQVAALAFPVPDGIVDKIQLRHAPKIVDGENRIKHRLQPAVLAFRGEEIHLQKALVGPPLDFDEVGNLDDSRYFREVDALTHSAVPAVRHSWYSLLEDSWA